MEAVKGPDTQREEAFCDLVGRHQAALLRTCCCILNDPQLAQDAVQDTFLKAYKAFGGFRKESSEKTWLMRIAVNTCRDMKRRAWFRLVDRRMPLDRLPEPSVPFTPRDDTVLQCISRLPQKEREAILLYFYQDLTLEEAGQALGVPRSTVNSRLERAKARLKKMLEGEEQDE